MVSRIPHTFIFCVVKYNLKNSQFISFNKLFCYEKDANLDAAVGFPTKINHSGIQGARAFNPTGICRENIFVLQLYAWTYFWFINVPLLCVYILKVFILV